MLQKVQACEEQAAQQLQTQLELLKAELEEGFAEQLQLKDSELSSANAEIADLNQFIQQKEEEFVLPTTTYTRTTGEVGI